LARLYRAQGKNDDAINNFIEAGKKYYNKENYTEAITDFTDVINLGGGTAEIYNLRGLSYYNLENPDYDAALNDFNKAIQLDKNFADAYAARAAVYLKQDKKDEAISNFTLARKKHLFAQNYDDAKEAFNLVLELDPKNGEVYYHLGQLEDNQQRWQEAINNYDKAIELNYAEDYVYTERGSTKCMLHKYDDAIKDFNKALEIDVTHADAYRWRGDAYLCLTKPDHEKAMADFESYLKFAENLDDDTIKSYEDKIEQCRRALRINDPIENLKRLAETSGLGEFNNFLKVLFITMLIYSAGLFFLGVRERNLKYVGTFVVTNGIILLLLMLANELGVRNFFIIIAVGYMLIELIKKADAAGIPALQWIIDLITKFRDGSSGQGRR